MTSQQIGLIVMQSIFSLGVTGFLVFLLIRAREQRRVFQLFAVRDRFLFLAATGALPQSSQVFRVFYAAINAYVDQIDRCTIVSFVKASMAVRTQIERENTERLMNSLRRSPPEVQAAIDDFVRIVMEALRYNSPMLNIILGAASHCHSLLVLIRRKFEFQPPVYETYKFYEGIHGSLSLDGDFNSAALVGSR